MNFVRAIQPFRSRTASLSPRTLRASAADVLTRRNRLLGSGRRNYSDDKVSGDELKENQTETPKEVEEPESEVVSKLKVKEMEVVDLIVSSLRPVGKSLLLNYLQGQLRYLQADFLNLQRNAAREREQIRDFAVTRFAGDLLEVVDVLSLALKSVPQAVLSSSKAPFSAYSSPLSDSPTEDIPPSAPPTPTSDTSKSAETHLRELHTGVEMTHRLLLQTLFKYHVKPFDPTGDKFDPNRHEALYQAPIAWKDPGTVIDCQKIGYTIKDRILRAAQVGVAQEAQS
jgi:molecular chaperone GrpE